MTEDYANTRQFRKLVGWVAILSFVVMTLGALVRATDSGLACPDWPLCYGQAVPVFDTQIFLEWFHRVLAGLLSLGVLFLGFRVYRSPRLRRKFGVHLLVVVALLIVQIILGGLTVLKLLDPSIVSFHLINAVLFYSVLLWIYFTAVPPVSNTHFSLKRSSAWAFWYGLLTFGVLCQIFVGGMVSTNHAGLVCPDFPTCHGSWWPMSSFLIWLQMGHRYIGLLLLAASALGAAMSFGHASSLPSALKRLVLIVPVLMLMQILLGVINVYWQLPVWASVLHLANALALYSILLVITVTARGIGQTYSYDVLADKYPQQSLMREAGL